MNIFVTSPDPRACARVLDNVRLNKMVLETAQLLSTWVHLVDPGGYQELVADGSVYRPTHLNHPCTRWLIDDPTHAYWLCHHGQDLADEYATRRNRQHASRRVLDAVYRWAGAVWASRDTSIEFADVTKLNLPALYEVGSRATGDAAVLAPAAMTVFQRYRVYLEQKWAADAAKGRPPRWGDATEFPGWEAT